MGKFFIDLLAKWKKNPFLTYLLIPHNRDDLYLWKYLILVVTHGLNLTLTALNNSQTEVAYSELFIW